MKKTGGRITTSDVVDYRGLPPWSGIKFIPYGSHIALRILEGEGHKIDFAFFDWIPDEGTLRAANRIFTEDAILCTHDYFGRGSKGADTIDIINNGYARADAGTWFLPNDTPYVMPDGVRINMCTAFFLPHCLIDSMSS